MSLFPVTRFPQWANADSEQSTDGVNGHDVTDKEQLFNPGESLIPDRFKKDAKEERSDITGGKYPCEHHNLLH